jgi:hypothetical protein
MMFHRLQEYGLIESGGRSYRPRAYGDPQPDGTWDGWLVFFPFGGGVAIAPPGPETTQSTAAAVTSWASALSPVYLEGALDRALRVALEPPVIARLTAAEYAALADAERLEDAAEVERNAAELDEVAAGEARIEAEEIRQERLAAEAALAAAERDAAEVDAVMHEQAARDARAIAGDAEDRRRSAEAEADPPPPASTRRGTKR